MSEKYQVNSIEAFPFVETYLFLFVYNKHIDGCVTIDAGNTKQNDFVSELFRTVLSVIAVFSCVI